MLGHICVATYLYIQAKSLCAFSFNVYLMSIHTFDVISTYPLQIFFISLYSQLQWEQYVDHYCRDFPCLFTKPIAATDGYVSMDEGEVIVLLLLFDVVLVV